ncbi:hypothetical protein AC630_39300 [Bradyrhizobium sp. AS23.2]|nr:hypothetical protein AC630_39300 [Bradyrhizobium sp. AS23.2]
MLPPDLRERLRKRFPADPSAPPVGHVRWGDLRRTAPISRNLWDRGLPIDRYYIESFLAANAGDVAGRVLEVKDNTYTRRFGGTRVTNSDVLDVNPANPHATIVADLNAAGNLPGNAFDCIIITQTLQYVFDVASAIEELHRSLKPGGALLATVPGITPIDQELRDSTYWTFTDRSMRRLFEHHFPLTHLTVVSHGNVLSAVASLQGLSVDDLRPEELSPCDADFAVVITVRATKP